MLPFHMKPDDLLTYLSIAGVIFGALAWMRKKTKPVWNDIKQIAQDWKGVPDRPGVKGRPGVMVQMDRMSKELEAVRVIATEARYHSMPNGGNSAYDKLTQKMDQNREQAARDTAEVREDTGTLIRTLAEHTTSLEALNERMTASEKDREGIHREISVFKFGGTERQQS